MTVKQESITVILITLIVLYILGYTIVYGP
jgi:hypothetical protein